MVARFSSFLTGQIFEFKTQINSQDICKLFLPKLSDLGAAINRFTQVNPDLEIVES